MNPEDAPTWSRLGVVADALGARDEARAHYRMALELDPYEVINENKLKLEARYGKGFKVEKSEHRKDGDL